MTEAVFARYPGELQVTRTGLRARGKEIDCDKGNINIYIAAGVSSRSKIRIHACLVLTGGFSLSWTRQSDYDCLLFHRTDDGICVSGMDSPGDARELLCDWGRNDEFGCYQLGRVECSKRNIQFLSHFAACMRADLAKPGVYRAVDVKPGDSNCVVFALSCAISLGVRVDKVVDLTLRLAQRDDVIGAVGVSPSGLKRVMECIVGSLPGASIGAHGSSYPRAQAAVPPATPPRTGGGSSGTTRLADTPCRHGARCNNRACGYKHPPGGTDLQKTEQLLLDAFRSIRM
jgi:hypothetical protein